MLCKWRDPPRWLAWSDISGGIIYYFLPHFTRFMPGDRMLKMHLHACAGAAEIDGIDVESTYGYGNRTMALGCLVGDKYVLLTGIEGAYMSGLK